jgi:hypothetical protein
MTPHQIRKILSNPMVKKLQNHRVAFNNKYEIPFIFGLSADGRTMYFDKNFPRYFRHRNRMIDNYTLLKSTELLRIALKTIGVNPSDSNEVCAKLEQGVVKEKLGWDSEKYAMEFLSKYAYDGGQDFHKSLPPDLDVSDIGLNDSQKSEMQVLKRYRSGEATKMLTSPHEQYKLKRKQKDVRNLYQGSLSRVQLNKESAKSKRGGLR